MEIDPTPEPSGSDEAEGAEEQPKDELRPLLASYGLRVHVRGPEGTATAENDELVAAVRTMLAELVPGTTATVTVERLDR